MYQLPSVLAVAAAAMVALWCSTSSVSAGTSYRNRFRPAGGMAQQIFPGQGMAASGFPASPNGQAGSMNYGGMGGMGGFSGAMGGFPGFGGGAPVHGGGGGGAGGGAGAGAGGGLAGLASGLAGMLPAITGMIPGVLSLFGGGGGGGGGTNFGNGGNGFPAGANQGSGGGFPPANAPGATGGGGSSGIWTGIGSLISTALPLIMNLLGGGGGGGGGGGRGRSNNEAGRMMAAVRILETGTGMSANDPVFQAAIRNAMQQYNNNNNNAGRKKRSVPEEEVARSRRQALNPQITYECPFSPLNMTECGRMDRVGLTECTSKSDCGGEEYCCLGGKYGCDFVCTKPIMPEIIHSGSCPSISMSLLMKDDTKFLFESCTTECQVDEDCGSNEKCCDYILGECQQNVCLKAV